MSKIKDKIDNILQTYGSDVTVLSNEIYEELDEWGDVVVTSSSIRTIKAVKDQNLLKKLILNSTGRVNTSSSVLIVNADEVFGVREDKVIFESQTYNITEINPLEISNKKLAQILTLGLD